MGEYPQLGHVLDMVGLDRKNRRGGASNFRVHLTTGDDEMHEKKSFRLFAFPKFWPLVK
jgi:hypothetical protein